MRQADWGLLIPQISGKTGVLFVKKIDKKTPGVTVMKVTPDVLIERKSASDRYGNEIKRLKNLFMPPSGCIIRMHPGVGTQRSTVRLMIGYANQYVWMMYAKSVVGDNSY